MQVHFDGPRRPARVAKMLRSELAAAGIPVGLARAQDITARAFGYATYKELVALSGRREASAWDESSPDKVVRERRARQASALVEAGLTPEGAAAVVERVRPSGRTLGPAPAGTMGRTEPDGGKGFDLPVEIASEYDIGLLIAQGGRLLTAPGGPMELPERLTRHMALMENGTLVVSRADAGAEATSAFRRLALNGSHPVNRIIEMPPGRLRHLYDMCGRREDDPSVRGGRAFLFLLKTAVEFKSSQLIVDVTHSRTVVRMVTETGEVTPDPMTVEDGLRICEGAFNLSDQTDRSYKPADYQKGRIPSGSDLLPQELRSVALQFHPLHKGGRHLAALLDYVPSEAVERLSLSGLGYTESQVPKIRRMRRRPGGIAIIAGPDGSGRSLSLKRIIEQDGANWGRGVAVIQEHPKYEIDGAVHYPVNGSNDEERKEGHRQAIDHALRSNPEVIHIGELSRFAVATMAWQAASIGKQVWATAKARDVMSVFDHLVDLGMAMPRIADHTVVNGVIAQRLVRRLCATCSVDAEEAVRSGRQTPDRVMEVLGIVGGQPRWPDRFGCRDCSEGYSGRTLVAEVVVPDEHFMQLIAGGKRIAAQDYWLNQMGGTTMMENAAVLVSRGTIDADEVERRIGLLDEVSKERLTTLTEDGRRAA